MKAVHVLVVAATLAASAVADDAKFDPGKLVGTWKITGGKKAGADLGDMAKDGTYVVTKETITIKAGDMDLFVIKYKVDPKASPAAIDMEITKSPGDSANGSKAKGIIEVAGDELKICYTPMDGDRPTKFDGEKNHYFTLKRQKDAKKTEKKEDK